MVSNATVKPNVHFSSKNPDWGTPQDLFDKLDNEFVFTLDPCATRETAKCAKYFTPEDDGLAQDWTGERVFMNPPYGREIGKWMEKAAQHAAEGGLVVCLVPSRTDTKWWHEHVTKASVIRFIQGRLKFQGAKNSAPFPSAVIVYYGEQSEVSE